MHSFPQFTASTSDVLHKTLRPFEEQVCVINGTFDRFILLPITLSLKRFCHFMNYFIRMNLNMAPITLMIIRVTGNKICASSSNVSGCWASALDFHCGIWQDLQGKTRHRAAVLRPYLWSRTVCRRGCFHGSCAVHTSFRLPLILF